MKSFRWISLTLLVFAVAGFALAQNADKNTAAPTRNDYRLRVVQPTEGATITGHNVQVVVDTEIPAERDQPHDINSMPHPFVDVFLDDLFQGTMRGDENVVNVANVAPGPHTIVLLAKNVSGEIIDREVMHIVTVLPPKPVVEQPVAPPPAYVPPPPAPAPSIEPPAPMPVEQKLPPTGTSDPLLAVAGLVLLAGGIAVRRLV
jgi:LPXTG-motif cell wall-anchored protein